MLERFESGEAGSREQDSGEGGAGGEPAMEEREERGLEHSMIAGSMVAGGRQVRRGCLCVPMRCARVIEVTSGGEKDMWGCGSKEMQK